MAHDRIYRKGQLTCTRFPLRCFSKVISQRPAKVWYPDSCPDLQLNLPTKAQGVLVESTNGKRNVAMRSRAVNTTA